VASQGHSWVFALVSAVGAIFAAGGAALFRDYKGVATRHSDRTVRFVWPIHARTKQVPPWRWLPEWLAPSTREGATRNQVRVERAIGLIWMIVGLVLAIAGLIGLFS
jgi:hypothetical protein